MRIFLAGVSCVGKTTIGQRLAGLLECPFHDLDLEVERLLGASIEQLQRRYLTMRSFREAASQVLKQVVGGPARPAYVVALPPSGLMGDYWKVVRKTEQATIVAIVDRPENILERIVFYGSGSEPIQKHLTPSERRLYLREIKRDIAYFGATYERAHIVVDIAGLGPDEAAREIRESLTRNC